VSASREATAAAPRRVAESALARLRNGAMWKRGMTMDHALSVLAAKRFLARADAAGLGGRLVLRGGHLMLAWTGEIGRPTFDVDLQLDGEPPEAPGDSVDLVRRIAAVDLGDGMDFSALGAKVVVPSDCAGVTVSGDVLFGATRIPFKVDLGYGDPVTPAPGRATLPALYDGDEAVEVGAYPPETVVAEKVHAMWRHGMANSRLKDLLDVMNLTGTFRFDGAAVRDALVATWRARDARPGYPRVSMAAVPAALTPQFVRAKSAQWRTYLMSQRIRSDLSLEDVAARIRPFVCAVAAAAAGGGDPGIWDPGAGWLAREPAEEAAAAPAP
jgi:hypothetical protein